eukprot:Opistho-2@34406
MEGAECGCINDVLHRCRILIPPGQHGTRRRLFGLIRGELRVVCGCDGVCECGNPRLLRHVAFSLQQECFLRRDKLKAKAALCVIGGLHSAEAEIDGGRGRFVSLSPLFIVKKSVLDKEVAAIPLFEHAIFTTVLVQIALFCELGHLAQLGRGCIGKLLPHKGMSRLHCRFLRFVFVALLFQSRRHLPHSGHNVLKHSQPLLEEIVLRKHKLHNVLGDLKRLSRLNAIQVERMVQGRMTEARARGVQHVSSIAELFLLAARHGVVFAAGAIELLRQLVVRPLRLPRLAYLPPEKVLQRLTQRRLGLIKQIPAHLHNVVKALRKFSDRLLERLVFRKEIPFGNVFKLARKSDAALIEACARIKVLLREGDEVLGRLFELVAVRLCLGERFAIPRRVFQRLAEVQSKHPWIHRRRHQRRIWRVRPSRVCWRCVGCVGCVSVRRFAGRARMRFGVAPRMRLRVAARVHFSGHVHVRTRTPSHSQSIN